MTSFHCRRGLLGGCRREFLEGCRRRFLDGCRSEFLEGCRRTGRRPSLCGGGEVYGREKTSSAHAGSFYRSTGFTSSD